MLKGPNEIIRLAREGIIGPSREDSNPEKEEDKKTHLLRVELQKSKQTQILNHCNQNDT